MKIGEAIQRSRKEFGVNQAYVADRVKVARSYISMIESGFKTPSPGLVEKIAKVLKTSVPAIVWDSIELTDVPKNKREMFLNLKKTVDTLIKAAMIDDK